MANIFPFRGIFYNPEKIKDISQVVSPPYDVISQQEQGRFYHSHPLNIIRIDCGKIFSTDTENNNRYIRARDFFKEWLKEKILIQDKSSCFYLLAQKFRYQRKDFLRWGIICRLKLSRNNRVFFHEKTSAKPKEDRFKLLKKVKANLNPIFAIFEDNFKLIEGLSKIYYAQEPFIKFKFLQVEHYLWRIDNLKLINRIEKYFQQKDIFIADGHHRYEVSILYQKYCRERNPQHTGKEAYNYVMVYLTPLKDKALKILPTHRLLKKLPADFEDRLRVYFEIIPCPRLSLLNLLSKAENNLYLFGMYLGKEEYFLLRLKRGVNPEKIIPQTKPAVWKRLEVSLFHFLIIEKVFALQNSDFDNIFYTQDLKEAIRRVKKGEFKVAFFLRPTPAYAVKEIALLKERMPHKSTYFYPKLPSGLIINPV
ncbi:MAG: DUF1015 domain-containing protein [Candidatus Omnitrophica bacterium]|nr:DUF1015 domain-containing protein [Candidatus Omnitrophota bacterium]